MTDKLSKLEVLKKKQTQLQARIDKMEHLEKSRERKRDTRRKILVGSYFIDKAKEEGTLDLLYQQLEHYLKRDSDRKLFQLMPLMPAIDAGYLG